MNRTRINLITRISRIFFGFIRVNPRYQLFRVLLSGGTVPGAVATGRPYRIAFFAWRPIATAPGTVPPRVPMLFGSI